MGITFSGNDIALFPVIIPFSAMSIAESSKEPGYGEDNAAPLPPSSSYSLSHSNSFGGSSLSSRHSTTNTSSSVFSQQPRTQLWTPNNNIHILYKSSTLTRMIKWLINYIITTSQFSFYSPCQHHHHHHFFVSVSAWNKNKYSNPYPGVQSELAHGFHNWWHCFQCI